MKATLLFTALSLLLALPGASGMTEIETLRARCAAQEREIHRLEAQLQRYQPSNEVKKLPTSPVSPLTSGTPQAATQVHVVKAGESLERIARRHGCTSSQLARMNGIRTSSVIRPGQKLKLPGGATPSSTSAAQETTSSALAGKTHTIRQGETYSSISRKYKVSVKTLMAANPGVKATALCPGQVIRLSSPPLKQPTAVASTPRSSAPRTTAAIPVANISKPATTPVPKPAPKSEPTPQPLAANTKPAAVPPAPKPEPAPLPKSEPAPAPAEPDRVASSGEKPDSDPAATPISSPNPEKRIRSVTIDGEMTYGEFAAAHGTDTDRLNDLNGLDLTNATVLAKGSELYVPAQP